MEICIIGYSLCELMFFILMHFFTKCIQIRKLLLVGPNLQRESSHLAQLNRELPNLITLTFYHAELHHTAVRTLANNFRTLTHLRLVGWRSLGSLAPLSSSVAFRKLSLEACTVNYRQLIVCLTDLPNLEVLKLINMTRVTPYFLDWVKKSRPLLLVIVHAEVPVATARRVLGAITTDPTQCSVTSAKYIDNTLSFSRVAQGTKNESNRTEKKVPTRSLTALNLTQWPAPQDIQARGVISEITSKGRDLAGSVPRVQGMDHYIPKPFEWAHADWQQELFS